MTLSTNLAAACFGTLMLATPWATVAQPGENPADIVQASVLADATAIESGKPVTLGVLFKIKPEWHIYWTNPGESGFETKVEWGPATAGTFGPTQYPAPIKFISPGPLVSYGYADSVLLMTTFRPVLAPGATGPVELTVNAKWLMCRERCIPGKAELKLQLPVGTPQPANQEVFAKTRATLPKQGAWPDWVAVATRKGERKTDYEIRITPPDQSLILAENAGPLRGVEFFPYKNDDIEFSVLEKAPTDAKVSVEGKEQPAYNKAFWIRFSGKHLDEKSAATPGLNGVLVLQKVSAEGKAGDPLLFEINSKH